MTRGELTGALLIFVLFVFILSAVANGPLVPLAMDDAADAMPQVTAGADLTGAHSLDDVERLVVGNVERTGLQETLAHGASLQDAAPSQRTLME